jgi:hypothetical protein
MNYIFCVLVYIELQVILCQRIERTFAVNINDFGWIPWDISETGNLYFFSESTVQKCEHQNNYICTPTSNHKFNADIIAFSQNPSYIIDYHSKLIHIQTSRWFNVTLPDLPVKYDLLKLNTNNAYIDYGSYLRIYPPIYDGMDFSSSEFQDIYHQTTKWTLLFDGIYSFVQDKVFTFLTKISFSGVHTIWNVSIPECNYIENPTFHLTADSGNVFVVCGFPNMLFQMKSGNGNLLKKIPLDSGNIVLIKSTDEFLFILFNDSRIVQYTIDQDYVHTYKVPRKKLPPINKLEISRGYLFYVLCEEGNYQTFSCKNPLIYQLEIKRNIEKTTVKYKFESHRKQATIFLEFQDSPIYRRVNGMSIQHVSWDPSIIIEPNSFVHPIAVKKNNSISLKYFSGAGDLKKSTCGDVLFHSVEINSTEEKPFIHSKTSFFLGQGSERCSVGDYASVLASFGGKYYYIIHGGISCDLETIYSRIIFIDISENSHLNNNIKATNIS